MLLGTQVLVINIVVHPLGCPWYHFLFFFPLPPDVRWGVAGVCYAPGVCPIFSSFFSFLSEEVLPMGYAMPLWYVTPLGYAPCSFLLFLSFSSYVTVVTSGYWWLLVVIGDYWWLLTKGYLGIFRGLPLRCNADQIVQCWASFLEKPFL